MGKRILDEETRRTLLGFVPFSVDAKIIFTPPEFDILAADLRPVFELRSLNQAEMIQLKKNAMSYTSTSTTEQINAIADANADLIRGCLRGWSNLFDSGSGQEIDFIADPTGGCEKNLFKTLPAWLIRSFTEFVKKISGLSMAEDLSLK